MISSVNSFGRLSATDLAKLFSVNSSSPTSTSTSVTNSTTPGVSVFGAGDAAKSIQAILTQAKLENAPIATLGGGLATSAGANLTHASQAVSSSSLLSTDRSGATTYATVSKVDIVGTLLTGQTAISNGVPNASTTSSLSTTTQNIYDAVTAVANSGADVSGKTVGLNLATLALATGANTDSGTTSETASVAAGNLNPYTTAYLQSLTINAAQGAAQDSQQDRSLSPASTSSNSTSSAVGSAGSSSDLTSAQTAHSAIRLTIYAKDSAAFTLGEAQAKQLVSDYETYLSQSGSTTKGGFSFYETYGEVGGRQGNIEIDGVLTSDSGQSGLSTSITRQQTTDEGVEAFMVPLHTS